MTEHQGRCLCGKISYSYDADPLFTAICHCRHCQRQTGSAFSVVTGVMAETFRLNGSTRVFSDIGESGEPVARHFCGDCGSPVMSILGALPDMIFIKSGTLDDFADVRPTLEVFCDHVLPWQEALDGTARYARSNLGAEAL